MIKKISRKDLLVLSYLRKNARMKLTTMSRLTRLPVSTIFDRIKSTEGDLIKKHLCIINFPKLGFNTKAQLMLKINKKDKENVRNFLLKHHNVNSLYKINNGFDLMAECIFRNFKDFEEFVEKVEDDFSIKSKNVYYIIDDIKKEDFFSNPEMIDIIVGEDTS